MKKITKKLLALLLASILTFGLLPVSELSGINFDGLFSVTAEAETVDVVGSYPLDIEIRSNKANYGAIDTATFTVTIKNISSTSVSDISSKCNLDGLSPIGKNNTFYVDNVTLKPGESITYSYNATINPNSLNFFMKFILQIKRFFSGSQAVTEMNFEDGRNKTTDDVTVKFSSEEVTETVSVWYQYDTEIINAATDEEFSAAVTSLVNDTYNSKNFDLDDAVKDAYYSCRVIAECGSFENIDFDSFNCDTMVTRNDGIVILQFSSEELAENCINVLNAHKDVVFAEPDMIMVSYDETLETSPAEGLDHSWGEEYIYADKFANYLEKNGNYDLVTVAVVDSGVDMDHPLLKSRVLNGGWDFVDGDGNPDDLNGHGTHVAGIIADCTDNLNVKILPIRVLNSKGSDGPEKNDSEEPNVNDSEENVAYVSIVALGIETAVNHGVDVINLSLGSTRPEDYKEKEEEKDEDDWAYDKYTGLIEKSVKYAVDNDIVVCAAAGNGDENGNPVDTSRVCPASIEDIIVVGAIDSNGNIGSYSNYGKSVDVCAPGNDIYSTVPVELSSGGSGIGRKTGTSMATPHVAAAAAMLRLANPDCTASQIEEMIKQNATDLGDEGKDDYCGYGCVNLYNLIPNCTVKFDTDAGNSIPDVTIKNGTDVELPTPQKSLTITFDANGGSISKSSKTVPYGFGGWYKNESFSGAAYEAGNGILITSNTVLYAKWNNPQTGELPVPLREHYNFVGWYTAASGGTYVSALSTLSGDTKLYAHWSPVNYTIVFDPNGGTANTYSVAANCETPLHLVNGYAPYSSYYDFLGWSTVRNGAIAYHVGDDLTNTTSSKTLYARWGHYGMPLRNNSQYGVPAKTYRPCIPDTNFDSSGNQIYCPVYEFSFYTGDTIPANGCIYQWYYTNGTYNGTTYPKQHQAFYFNSSRQLVYESQVTNTSYKNVFTYSFSPNTFYRVTFEFFGELNTSSTKSVKMSVYDKAGSLLYSGYPSGNTYYVQFHQYGTSIFGASSSARFTVAPNILLCGYRFYDAAYYDSSTGKTPFASARAYVSNQGSKNASFYESNGTTAWYGTSLTYITVNT